MTSYRREIYIKRAERHRAKGDWNVVGEVGSGGANSFHELEIDERTRQNKHATEISRRVRHKPNRAI